MVSLILVVISIALLASVAAVTINHIPADALVRQQMHKEAEAGLQTTINGVGRYLNSTRDGSGNIIYPGDGVNVAPLFAPNYGFMPADVSKQMTWEVMTAHLNQDLPAVAICLRPIDISSTTQVETLEQLRGRMPVGSTFVSNACGAISNTVGGTHLTHWLPLAHIN